MSWQPVPKCEKCGNQETIEQKRDFLGFGKCTCTVCKARFANPYSPLTKAYRIGYWIIAFWMGIILLNISTAKIQENGVFTFIFAGVFLFAAIRALRIDAAIRRSIRMLSQ